MMLALLPACVGPLERYEALRASCGLDSGDWPALPFGSEGEYVPISTECSSAWGEPLGLDWDSFDSKPHRVTSPTEEVDYLLGSTFLLSGANLGAVDDWVEQLDDASALGVALANWREEYSSLAEAPAGVFLVDFVDTAVQLTRLNAPNGGMMTYGMGILDVEFRSSDDGAVGIYEHPVFYSSAIVHEVAHSVSPDHVTCPDGTRRCDADFTGAWGAGIAFQTFWLANNRDDVSEGECEMIEEGVAAACSMVLDTHGLEVCDEPSAGCS